MEKLNDVTFEQAQKLKTLGFDWNCGCAYDIEGNDVNWTTKQFNCWKPTIALALKFVRYKYGLFYSIYVRSWSKNKFGFSVSHAIADLDLIHCDLMEKGDDNEDGIVSFDYEESESIALDQAIRYLLKKK